MYDSRQQRKAFHWNEQTKDLSSREGSLCVWSTFVLLTKNVKKGASLKALQLKSREKENFTVCSQQNLGKKVHLPILTCEQSKQKRTHKNKENVHNLLKTFKSRKIFSPSQNIRSNTSTCYVFSWASWQSFWVWWEPKGLFRKQVE